MSDQTSAPAADPGVIDFALFNDSLRTVQALRNSGIIPDDAAQAKIQIAKRVHRALTADYSGDPMMDAEALAGMRAEFKHYMNTLPYEQLVEGGHVNRLLDEYLGLLVKSSRKTLDHLDHDPLAPGEASTTGEFNAKRRKAEARLIKYLGERGYYTGNPDAVKDVARQFGAVITRPEYLPIGKIIALSGACGGDAECVADLVHDVLGVQAARELKTKLKEFTDDATIASYAADPEANAVRIRALAQRVAQVTAPLSSLQNFTPEAPDLDRITGLSALISAELHYALMQAREPEQMIAVERNAREHLREAARVALSLAYYYLDTGPSATDPRTRAIQANLKKEMDGGRDLLLPENERNDPAVPVLMPMEDASAKAAELARKSAEDLMQVQQVHNDPKLAGKITALAKAAGAEPPVEAKSHLIGQDLLELIREKLQQPGVIAPKTLAGFVQTEEERRAAGKGGALALTG